MHRLRAHIPGVTAPLPWISTQMTDLSRSFVYTKLSSPSVPGPKPRFSIPYTPVIVSTRYAVTASPKRS
eukprot:gene10123-biopygen10131